MEIFPQRVRRRVARIAHSLVSLRSDEVAKAFKHPGVDDDPCVDRRWHHRLLPCRAVSTAARIAARCDQRFIGFAGSSSDFGFFTTQGVGLVLYQNVRASLIAAALGMFTFGVLSSVVLMLPLSLAAYFAGQAAIAGYNPLIFSRLHFAARHSGNSSDHPYRRGDDQLGRKYHCAAERQNAR